MSIQNKSILDSSPNKSNGYITQDGIWAVVAFSKKFMVIHNGKQDVVFNNLDNAKSYIFKQIKSRKKSSSLASLFKDI